MDPKDPRISMFASCNRALPLSCLAVGVAMTFPGTPLMWYAIKELDVDPDRMSVLGTLVVSRLGGDPHSCLSSQLVCLVRLTDVPACTCRHCRRRSRCSSAC